MWLYPILNSFMCRKITCTRGCKITLIAFAFFPTVCFNMGPKSTWFNTRIFTLVTFIGFFSTVRFQMSSQMTCPSWGKITMVAFVWLFTFMHVHMIPQMSYLSAGKLITFIWLLSTVIFCMYVSSKKIVRKAKLHWSHLFGLSPLCIFTCVFKFCLKDVAKLHWSHLWSFSVLGVIVVFIQSSLSRIFLRTEDDNFHV